MQVEQKGINEVVITGNIKTVDDSHHIKNVISGILDRGTLNIHIHVADSFSMPSIVIGYLMKITGRDQAKLSISVGDNRLYHLLDELCLIQAFNVRASSSRII